MDPQAPENKPTGENQPNSFVEAPQSPPAPASGPNAFTALADKVAPDGSQGLDSADIPKTLAKWQDIKGMFVGGIIFLAGIVIAVVVYAKNHSSKDLLIIIAADILISALIFFISFISYKQLKKAQANPPTFNQFQSGTAVSYKTPLATAVIAADETLGAWLGPVNTGGKQGISFQLGQHESDHQATNTLLFTNKQIIAVLLGPQDAPSSLAGGLLNQVASSAVQYSNEDENAKNEQFILLYSRKWEAIMQNLTTQSLQSLPQNHLTYGIPFNQIDHVEVRHSLVNPGLVIHMTDGKKLTYPTLRKDLLDQAQTYLQQYIKIQ